MTHAVLPVGQIQFVERAAIPEANRCSPLGLREFVQITLLGSAAVLTQREGAMFLVKQATGTRRKRCLSFQSAGHRVSPIDDDPLHIPAAKEEGFEVWH